MIVLEHVSLLLVEELNTLLSMAKKHILGVNDNFGASLGSIDASKDFESSVISISENDLLLTVCRFVGLLKKDALRNKVDVVQV